MRKAIKIYGLLLCTWLMACMCISCSEDVIDDNPAAQQGKKGSVSFRLKGIDTGISTRAAQNIDFSRYAVKCYVFERVTDDYDATLVRDVDVLNSLITFENLKSNGHYYFVFFAVRSVYEDKLVLKEYTEGNYSNYVAPQDAKVDNSNYLKCFLQVFDETQLGTTGGFLQPYTDGSNEEFMIYGALSEYTVPEGNTEYQMQEITLKRLMGAVEFNANNVGEITACKVYSNFYRLYLTQMQINDPTTLNKVTDIESDVEIGDSGIYERYSDLTGMWGGQYYIGRTFTGDEKPAYVENGANCYRILLPCTTVRGITENIPNTECANTIAGTQNSFGEGFEENDIPTPPTTVTINGTEYVTKSPFPIFPNRTTVLTVGNGNQLTVSFKGVNGSGGIDVDDDKWDGWKD